MQHGLLSVGPHDGHHGPHGPPARLHALRGPNCDTGAVWAGVGSALRRWLLEPLSGSYRPVRISHAVQVRNISNVGIHSVLPSPRARRISSEALRTDPCVALRETEEAGIAGGKCLEVITLALV